eukprot:3129293-Karenia_brevis.AAC.1
MTAAKSSDTKTHLGVETRTWKSPLRVIVTLDAHFSIANQSQSHRLQVASARNLQPSGYRVQEGTAPCLYHRYRPGCCT